MHLSSQGREQTIVVQRTNDGDRNLAIVARLGMSPFLFGRPHVRSCEFSKERRKPGPSATDVLHGLSSAEKVARAGYPLWTGAARRDKQRERMRAACRCLISQRFMPRNSVGTPSIFSWCRAS